MDANLSPFEQVADRVHRAVAEPESVTIGLVVGTTGALLIDTGSSPEQGRAIRDAAQAVAGDVPLTHVVVTHAHHDHLLGLAAFADLVTLGHRDLASSPSVPDGAALPTTTFGLATTVDLGDCHAELVHFGRGHTDHDTVVIVPGRRVVFAGDLLESAQAPQAGTDSWPAQWPTTLDGTLGTLNRDTVVVPGHGPVMSREECFAQRAELSWYADKAAELYDAGTPPEAAWSDDGSWPWAAEPSRQLVAAAQARLREVRPPRRPTLPLLNR